MAIYERQLMTKNKLINSNNYHSAVQLYHTADDDIVYYAVYKDPLDLDKNNKPKKKRYKVGRKSEGITEKYTKDIRDEIVVMLRRKEIPNYLKKTIEIEENIEKEIIFGDLSQLYFEERASNKVDGMEDKNIKNDLSILKNHLSIFLSLPIELITNNDIKELKKQKSKERELSTVNNILRLMRAILNYGINNKIIKDKPNFKLFGGIDNERKRWLNKDEILFLYKKIKGNKILSNFVKLSLSTGARLNAILRIKRKDIDLSEKMVMLDDSKRKSAGIDTQTTYIGFINEDILDDLADFIKDLDGDSYIFQYKNGNKVGVDYIQNNLQRIFDDFFNRTPKKPDEIIKDPKFRVVIHTLRHTFATQLAKKDIKLDVIKNLLNHTNIKTTHRYAHFIPEFGQNAISKLDIFK